MSFLRPFSVSVALLAGTAGSFTAAGPAAAADAANVVVEVQAQRNILPAGG